MNKKAELKVKPVKRYRQPKYPSHDDPDPTLHPQPIPYPASRKLISALAASAAVVVSASCTPPADLPLADAAPPDGNTKTVDDTSPQDATESTDNDNRQVSKDNPFAGASEGNDPFASGPDAGPDDVDDVAPMSDAQITEIVELIKELEDNPFNAVGVNQAVQAKTVQDTIDAAGGNPLCVALSGLPHQTSGFGTGMPNYVQADLARRVIEKVFRGAGYSLQSNQQYDRDGVAMVLDGYDADKKVGFVVVDWNNLDNDAILHWWAPPSKNDGKKYEAEINTLLQSIANNPTHQQLIADIQAAKKQADPARRSAAFKAILDKHRKGLLSLQEMKDLQDRARNKQEYIAVISTYDRRFAHPMFPHVSSTEQAEIDKIADPGKRQAAAKALLEKKASVAIKALEKAAREYIQWAQHQGLN